LTLFSGAINPCSQSVKRKCWAK